ncbi:MAG: hypothetical protein PUB21_08085 [Bacteroidales bacterium]|nr:hypothetical protein [Bacteroidales bacterium]
MDKGYYKSKDNIAHDDLKERVLKGEIIKDTMRATIDEMEAAIGQTIVVQNDTLLIVNGNPLLGTYTLSNGLKISMIYTQKSREEPLSKAPRVPETDTPTTPCKSPSQ